MADLADELLRDLEGDEDGDVGWNEEEEEVDAGSPGRDEIVMPTTAKKLGKRKAEDQDANGEDAEMAEDGDSDDEDDDNVQVKEEEVEMQIPEGGVRPAQELDADDVAQMQLKNIKDVSSVARLAGSKTFREVLQVGGQIYRLKCIRLTFAAESFRVCITAGNGHVFARSTRIQAHRTGKQRRCRDRQ